MKTFVDPDIVQWDKVPTWLLEGKKAMEEGCNFCSSYGVGCVSCQMWVHFLELANFFQD